VYSEICIVFVFSGSPPCPDYVTPLKKRRLARESLSSEQSFTPPTTPTMLADQHLSSSSPPTQKCVQYDVTGMNLVSLEWCCCLRYFHCLSIRVHDHILCEYVYGVWLESIETELLYQTNFVTQTQL
jgi:hypothetical protein